MEILFYDPKQKWGEFSNFYKSPIKIDNKTYNYTETYFQAEKYRGPNASKESLEYADIIMKMDTPGKAKKLARQKLGGRFPWELELNPIIQKYLDLGVKIRADWDQVKDDVMRKAVFAKFSTNPKLKQLLLSTGNQVIKEHTTRDKYWADGGDGTGKNMLGKILMETRDKLKN